MTYVICYGEKAVGEDIPALPKAMRSVIQKAIEERLKVDPVRFGKPLRFTLKGYRRLRVGDYRIVYQIKEETIFIVAIKHRKDIYE